MGSGEHNSIVWSKHEQNMKSESFELKKPCNDNKININMLKAKSMKKGFQKPFNTVTQVRKTH